MVSRAGATMVLASGEMKVKLDTNIVETHFLRTGQFKGLAASVGPVQVTRFGSTGF
jgi:hypothetical protein